MRMAPRPGSRTAGFTLIEIAIVMFLMVMLTLIAVPSVTRFGNENALRSCARELATQARTARRLAIQQQRPYEIRFDEAGFYLAPFGAGTNLADEVFTDLPAPHNLSADISWQLTRWAERNPSREKTQRWIFEPSGVCEPVRVRFDRTDSYLELSFHPLTAAVSEEKYEFR